MASAGSEYSAARTIGALVRDLADLHGETEALVAGGQRLTYADLDRRSGVLARRLLSAGAAKGSRVGILLPNGSAWVETFFAVGRIGAVALPLSTLLQGPELAWIIANAGIETLVCASSFRGHDYRDRLEAALPGLAEASGTEPLFLAAAPRLRRVVVHGPDGRIINARPWAAMLPEPEPSVDSAFLESVEAGVFAHDPLVVIHTSGSTADPKGVIHSHGALLGHTANMARHYVTQGPADRICTVRPWFWVAGLTADLFYGLQCGSTIIVPDATDAATIVDHVLNDDVHYVGALLPLQRQIGASDALAAHGVRCLPLGIDVAGIAQAGGDGVDSLRFRSTRLEAALPAKLAAGFVPARFPNLFGMTEALGSHSALPNGTQVPEGREGASGPAVPGMEHRLVDPATGEDIAPGGEGELLVRGDGLMLGLDRRDRREVFTADGWYPTGDICRLDADGWITFRTRLGDMVKVSGANVAPLEVERVLAAHQSIEEAVVAGIGEGPATVLTAFVVVLGDATIDPAELTDWLRTRLSSYKVPRRIIVVGRDDLPRTGSGKVRKHLLAGLVPDA